MKAIKILCITSSILVSSSLFAETPQPQQVNETTSKTMPYGDNPSLGRVLLYKTGKGIQNLGDSIQGASEKTSNKISEKWNIIMNQKENICKIIKNEKNLLELAFYVLLMENIKQKLYLLL